MSSGFRGRGGGGNRFPRGRGRHPAHLRGKCIGLFYAKKHREKYERPLGTILLSDQKKQQISALLKTCKEHNKTRDTRHQKPGAFHQEFLKLISENIFDKLDTVPSSIKPNRSLDTKHQESFANKQSEAAYVSMRRKRERLPAFEIREEIVQTVEGNRVCVISGETGCGKTTQVPQFVLDEYLKNGKGSVCRIVCTQPRRISAISVASRVAEERAERLGNSVGYQIRLEKILPRDTGSITFCTTGVLLKKMETDPTLSEISHLILDEIHERDVMSDFLISLLKKVILKRQDLRLILMSATLDSEKFRTYYDNCPNINIPGFTYHVEEYFLEDVIERTKFEFEDESYLREGKRRHGKVFREKMSEFREYAEMMGPHVRRLESEGKYSKRTCEQLRNPLSENVNLELILELLIDICEKETKEMGAILVFLTGYNEISKLNNLMLDSGKFPNKTHLILPLHSQMPTVDQRQIFDPPPEGVRKIILSTNIAETSITIDDIVFVIDCGKIKKTNFHIDQNIQTLLPEWVTKANANQRKGRAGRVKPGVCFHMYSRARDMTLDLHQTPEILRTRLETVILMVKILQLGKAQEFLGSLMDQPDERAIFLSVEFLQRLNALDEKENLTALGYHLAKLPVNPQIGKMLLLASIFSCLDPVLSVAASLDFKDAFQLPLGKEKLVSERKLELANNLKSDHLLLHEALSRFETVSDKGGFCWRYFLSQHTLNLLQNMKRQFMEYLYELNFVSDKNPKSKPLNLNSENKSLVKAIICAGLYPNVAVQRPKKFKSLFYTINRERLEMHPKSVLCGERTFESPLVVYFHRMKSTADFIHDATIVHPLPFIFFGDRFLRNVENGIHTILIAEKLKFKCSESTTELILELRDCLSDFLEKKISNPGFVDWSRSNNTDIQMLIAIMELITSEDLGDIDLDAYDDE